MADNLLDPDPFSFPVEPDVLPGTEDKDLSQVTSSTLPRPKKEDDPAFKALLQPTPAPEPTKLEPPDMNIFDAISASLGKLAIADKNPLAASILQSATRNAMQGVALQLGHYTSGTAIPHDPIVAAGAMGSVF